MKIVNASIELMQDINGEEVFKHIEKAGRTCYKSEDKITHDSSKKFVEGLIKRGHEAMLEHYNISVKVICDRGVSHEIVRHRIASYAQESTRYCNYSQDKYGNEITVIEPCFFDKKEHKYRIWQATCEALEAMYFELLKAGAMPEQARTVLPNSLKTEIIITMNLREWRHFLKLRSQGTTGKPHPQMKEIADMILVKFKKIIPIVFCDINLT